ncbi:hypothetical protein COC58_05000 [Bacillus cereus]|uniref:hypothetical protein n=1 Tax=Bacillus mobilis TaxID=2026190 RepID=UPI000BFCD1CB|nr:hypothetical protein COC58_05000 [Bacillus cereus]
MSNGIQLLIILLVIFVMFSIINFLAISLSVVAGFIFLLLTPIIFLTTTALTSTFDNAVFGAINLSSSIINVYILNGIVILFSASFILKKQNIR